MDKTLSTGKPVTTSAAPTEGYPAGNAVDGILDTYWDGTPYPQWLQVDLEKVATINEIHLHGYVANRRYYQYTIETSLDGEQWTTVVDESKSMHESTKEGYRHTVKPIRARHVRVKMLKNSANPGVHIRELRVFEADHAGSSPAE